MTVFYGTDGFYEDMVVEAGKIQDLYMTLILLQVQ